MSGEILERELQHAKDHRQTIKNELGELHNDLKVKQALLVQMESFIDVLNKLDPPPK